MEDTPNDNGLKIGARIEAEIRERIKFLENRIAGYRKHGRVTGKDETELEKLHEFLRSLGLALAICLISWPPLPSRAADLDGPPVGALSAPASRAPCGPYMSARTCLDAIRAETEACLARRFKVNASPAQQLECLDAALVETGALDD